MSTFKEINFLSCYAFIKRDRNKFGCGNACCITGQLPSRTIKIENPSDIEFLTIKIILRNNKILVVGMYKPPNLSETHFTFNLETIKRKPSNKHEKLILMGDFNMATSNPILSLFLDTFALSPLNVAPTCLKNSKNPNFIDLLLRNFKPTILGKIFGSK